MGTSSNITLGAGLLYAAPIGTTEPASSSATLPSAWRALGYTEEGSTFTEERSNEGIDVAEEFYPVRYATTSISNAIAFAMAETTRQNLALSTNQGAAAANDATALEPPAPGSEVRVMLVLDTQDAARWIFRQCFNGGTVEIVNRKAPDKRLLAVEFRLEKPTSNQPWKVYPNASGLI